MGLACGQYILMGHCDLIIIGKHAPDIMLLCVFTKTNSRQTS
jgi:hypothetical protein